MDIVTYARISGIVNDAANQGITVQLEPLTVRELLDTLTAYEKIFALAKQTEQRAEATEADARVLRTLLRTAVIHQIAPLALAPHETRNIGDLMTEYVDALFEAAGDNGAFANDQCNPAAVARVAESLGATLDDLPEAQP
jgi:hypothetical protein